VSVKATPVSATPAFGLVRLKVSEVVPLTGIVATPNALVIAGALATVKLAVAVFPVPPFVELTLPVVLVNWPEAVPVTFTTSVHVVLTAIVEPVRETIPEPATAVAVPPQLFVNPLGVATTIPAGSVSANATPVSAAVFAVGFEVENVSEVVPFSGIEAAPKALAIEGGASTVKLADAVPPVPPSIEVTCPVVLFLVPGVVPVTLTEKVHDALAARVPPERLTVPASAVAVTVPAPQVPVSPFGVETTKPAGSVSLNATPVIALVALLF
jgi:hypothetical protein